MSSLIPTSRRGSNQTPKASNSKRTAHSYISSHQSYKSKQHSKKKDASVKTTNDNIQPLTSANLENLPNPKTELAPFSESVPSVDPAQDEEVCIAGILKHASSKTEAILGAAQDLLNTSKTIVVLGKRKGQEPTVDQHESKKPKRARQASHSKEAEILKHSVAFMKEFRLTTEAHNDSLRIQVMGQLAINRSVTLLNQSTCLHCSYCASQHASNQPSPPSFVSPLRPVESDRTIPNKSLRRSSRIALRKIK
ncbi:hypothetical protein BGX21_005068 [Mortierella sp. AD011]|nr:hypothetical protein BGX21_005068 [Mortierella sp. AD011]